MACCSATGSSLPTMLAAFAPPPSHFVVQQPRSLTFQRAAAPQFDYRKSHHEMSSMKESRATNKMNGHNNNGRNGKSMRKIKSPSNSYTQFYKEGVLVGIERTSPNSRRISGEIIMDIPIDDIWGILTDYDNLSTHVPNLVESKVINNGSRIVGGRPRVYQRGAQRIFGFEFGADVTMDMTEYVHHDNINDESKMYSLDFDCVDSQFFSEFDGSWILEEYSNSKTMVRYIVDVRPKGPVPVAALEWRIKEDVPVNILAVSKSSRAMGAERRRGQEQDMLANQEEEVDFVPKTPPQPLSRPVQQSPPQPQSNPLQQAAYNLKQTAKFVLPAPVFSTAKQALTVINSSASIVGTVVPSMALNGGSNVGRASTSRAAVRKNRLSS
ncbi:hypothetical protein ACHAXR_005980, partial [Thalassiosira sp. AJA248-18]